MTDIEGYESKKENQLMSMKGLNLFTKPFCAESAEDEGTSFGHMNSNLMGSKKKRNIKEEKAFNATYKRSLA